MKFNHPKDVLRFPRYEDIEIQELILDIQVLCGRRQENAEERQKIRIEMGHKFMALKKKVKEKQGPRRWLAFYAEHFGQYKLEMRVVQIYMKLAKEADASPQNNELASFSAAIDQEAVGIADATEKAEKKINDAPKKEPLFKLALPLSPEMRTKVEQFCESKKQRDLLVNKVMAVVNETVMKPSVVAERRAS